MAYIDKWIHRDQHEQALAAERERANGLAIEHDYMAQRLLEAQGQRDAAIERAERAEAALVDRDEYAELAAEESRIRQRAAESMIANAEARAEAAEAEVERLRGGRDQTARKLCRTCDVEKGCAFDGPWECQRSRAERAEAELAILRGEQ